MDGWMEGGIDNITKNQSERHTNCRAQSATNTIFKIPVTVKCDQEL